MSKRALLVSVVTAMAVITAGCDDEVTPTDGGMTTQDGGMTGDIDGGTTGGDDGGTTGEDDGGTTGEDDGGTTGEDDGGTTGEDDGGTSGEDDGGTTGDDDGGTTGDVCGDGVVSGDETCDSAIAAGMPGACPTSCNDGLACTTDTLVGDAATCDAECTTTDITACTAGDGCCPSGCTMAEDDDCACTPRTTCTVDECGTVDDGCGNPLDCGACATGGACTTDADCAGDNVCATEEFGWTDGYCTIGCYDDSHCDTGAHCVGGDAASTTVGRCMPDCTTNSDCRTSGYSCQDWDGDTTLECAPSATGTGAVGVTCVNDADCAGGDDGFCAVEASGWQDGYCTLLCTTDGDCGAGSHCASNGLCLADCSTNADCRAAGYACQDADGDSVSECYLSATGTGALGDPCGQTFDCAGDGRGYCLQQEEWDLKDGSCTLVGCTAGGTGATGCPTGSHCGLINPSTGEGACLPDCTTGSCRADGYLCYDADGDSVNECWGAATGTGAVGAACAGTWDCAGGLLGFCIPPQDDGSLPGGYCTQACDTSACPSGSSCIPLTPAGDEFCVDDCSTDTDCRAGYACLAVDATTNICF